MMGLTSRQAECLKAIRDLTVEGVPPSLEELRARLGLSSKGQVHLILQELKHRRAVDWIPRRERSLVILSDQVHPRVLNALSDEALRTTMAHCAGILAQRMGGGRRFGSADPDCIEAAGRAPEGGVDV